VKDKVLQEIYQNYEKWLAGQDYACSKGCAACCTDNVTITAMEGELILDFVLVNNQEEWLATKLMNRTEGTQEHLTTNALARMCLNNIEPPPDAARQDNSCPLLTDNTCPLYQVRPFNCRCFASTEPCLKNGSASQPDELVAINTVTLQIIEHLGQGEFWGNMQDVLLALLAASKYRRIKKLINDEIIPPAMARLGRAEPLPGFLLLPAEEPLVRPYLDHLMTREINHKTIEQILNNQ